MKIRIELVVRRKGGDIREKGERGEEKHGREEV